MLDLLGALLHAVEVERVADGVGELVHALLERRASRGHEVLRRPGRSSSGAWRPTWPSHWRACSAVSPRRSDERAGHRVEPAGRGAREQAAAAVGDGDVREPGDADVERGPVRGAEPASARTMPNAERSMPSSFSPASRVAPTRRSTISRRTATTTTRAAGGRSASCTMPSDCQSTTASSIGIGMWSGACTLDGGGERLRVLERRQVERADDDALVGDPEAHARGQVVLGEEGLQRLGQGGHVGDLAVAQDAGPERSDGAAVERQRPVDGDLGGGDVPRIEIEADDRGLEEERFLNTCEVSAAAAAP